MKNPVPGSQSTLQSLSTRDVHQSMMVRVHVLHMCLHAWLNQTVIPLQNISSATIATAFSSLGLSPGLQAVLKDMGYADATPVQAMAIPPLLAGRDLIGQSRTGSGKTAAFAIPLLERLQAGERALQALVLCPTRDLCTQVAGEIRKLGRYQPNLQVLIVTGGSPVAPQAQALERGVHVVVATPGRLLDHLRRGKLALESVRTLILDEADRMLDMGFRDEITAILDQVPTARQTALFSATFDDNVLDLSSQYQHQPERVEIRELPAAIEQTRFEASEQQRPAVLLDILRSRPMGSVMVFCNTRKTVDAVTRQLQQAGIAADQLHGGLEQRDRDLAMARFRNHSTRVLVATDVAARGLDVAGMDAVINYELPPQPDTYVHRIGRSGRAGEQGLAFSLYSADEAFRITDIEAYTGLEIRFQRPQAAAAEPDAAAEGQAVNHAGPAAGPEQEATQLQTLCISGGRKDKLRPGDILGALTGDAGLDAAQVGRIEITDKLSYVALHADVAGKAMARLRAGKIKGRRFRVELV